MPILAKNRKAYYNYEILDKIEAGMKLKGWQVKSIKNNNVNIKAAFCYFQDNECFIKNIEIAVWPGMNEFDLQTKNEPIKLLLHKKQINKLIIKTNNPGITLIPLKLFSQRGLIKAELGLTKGKKKYDKRAKLKEKQLKRDIKKELKDEKYF